MSDSLFNIDVVRDFILDRGGKVTNHELVNHFKRFLNNPQHKVINRQKFKDFVNTLATVKLDESGEKMLVLKRRFRDTVTPSGGEEPVAQNLTPRHRPKAKKAKLAEQFERSHDESLDCTGASRTSDSSAVDRSGEDSLLQDVMGAIGGGLAAGEEASGSVSDNSSEHSAKELTPELEQAAKPEPEVDSVGRKVALPMMEEDALVAEEPASSGASTREIEPRGSVSESADVPSLDQSTPEAARPATADSSREVSPSDSVGSLASGGQEASPEAGAPETAEVCQTPALQKRSSADLPTPMSVKQRVEHLKRMESTDCLEAAPPGPAVPGAAQLGARRKFSKGGGGGGEDEDSSSVSSMNITLDAAEREWILAASGSEYQVLAKLLHSQPALVRRKDFTSGYNAIHWAAKHGNADVIKLCCGTAGAQVNARSLGGYTPLHLAAIHGHEHLIELLVQTYNADTDIRDYSGRKPKQYLRYSASTRAQQILQPRRLRTTHATGTMTTGFKRLGSFSAKIRVGAKSGDGGRGGGGAVRTSWTGEDLPPRARSATPSPNPSPRQSPQAWRKSSLGKDTDLMPPPQSLPPRRKRSKKGQKENLSDSDMRRSGSDPEIRRHTLVVESGV